MPDEVVETAHVFALHSLQCPTCSDAGKNLCPTGLALLKCFHDALHAMLAVPKEKYNA